MTSVPSADSRRKNTQKEEINISRPSANSEPTQFSLFSRPNRGQETYSTTGNMIQAGVGVCRITTTAGKHQLEGDAAGVVIGAVSVTHASYMEGITGVHS